MPPAFEVLLLNTAVPQIQAAQSGDTYVVPRDIAFSAALTLSAGTANGVPYLNGSKVVTTGSALTFDGTTFSVLATSLSTPAFKLFYNSSSQYGQHLMDANGIYVIESPAANGVTGGSLYLKAAASLLFGASSSEQMRLTSTGLGIGTSSPTDRLHVFGTASRFDKSNGVAVGQIRLLTATDSYASAWALGQPASSTNFAVQYFNGSSWSDAVTVNTSGNLGLGVVPSAWGTTFTSKVLQVGATSALYTNTFDNSLNLSNNQYDVGGGTQRYITTGNATSYRQASGAHIWSTAPSGLAGDPITFSQAMTLDAPATPRLLIGTTTAGVGNNSNTNLTVAGGATVYQSVLASGGQELYLIAQSGLTGVYARTNDPLLFGTNNTERARIKSTGQFRFVPLAADPAGAEAGDVYYNSGTNKLRLYDGTSWVDLN